MSEMEVAHDIRLTLRAQLQEPHVNHGRHERVEACEHEAEVRERVLGLPEKVARPHGLAPAVADGVLRPPPHVVTRRHLVRDHIAAMMAAAAAR
jgi:hypothetical protein